MAINNLEYQLMSLYQWTSVCVNDEMLNLG